MAYADLDKRRATHRRTEKRKRARVGAFLSELKSSVPCADCGIVYPPYVMDFDHLRDKVCAVSKCYSMTAVHKEIAKYEIVCSNCHRIRTYRRAHS